MAKWHFDGESVVIGLDVGWSEIKKSCAIAVEGLTVPQNESSWKAYHGGARPLAVGLFRYCDLITQIQKVFATIGKGPHRGIVVLDGPIGPNGQPSQNRSVDSQFTRGEFHGRMQPSPVEGESGRHYTAVTDSIVKCLFRGAGVDYNAGLWDGAAVGNRFCVYETHPTVGLALLLPQQNIETLPSRKRPRRITASTTVHSEANTPFVRAKSDWYWQLGAGQWIAQQALDCKSVGRETNHERVAGLYCLAVAKLLSEAPQNVVAVGADDGVYVIPAVVDNSWENGLNRIGILRGTLAPTDQKQYALAMSFPPVAVENSPTCDESDDAEKGDETILILNDDGGVWVQHNDWLEGLEPIVVVQALDEHGERIRLQQSAREDGTQWCPQSTEHKTLQLAKRRGFNGDHLSKENAYAIPIAVISSGP